jgi:porphobilinogen synthase
VTSSDRPITGPYVRPRRLRSSRALRRLVSETRLHAADLVLPLFVKEGISEPAALGSMPGVVQHTLASLPAVVTEAVAAGVGGIMLFGIPAVRDATGTQADAPDGILQQALRVAHDAAGGRLVVMSDLCLDEFTDHGHCGVLADAPGPDGAPRIDNDATLVRYQAMALAQAEAGADVLGLSGMMDGQVAAVRDALDEAGFEDTAILAYTAKYASAFYGPFREAVDSTLEGDRRTYQLDPGNGREGVRETDIDLLEGADVVMVKPAGTLDVLAAVAQRSDVPVAAYQVSGEYAMIEAAAANGWISRRPAIEESLTMIKRAGADIVLTYWAVEVAVWLKEQS